MKKIVNILIMQLLLLFPLYSQVNDIEEEVPVEKLILKNTEIPPALKSAVEKSYTSGNIFQYYSFPYLLKEYGWAFEKDMENMSENIPNQNLYGVHIKTKKGFIDAIYTKDGKLIRSKEVMKDVELPMAVLDSFKKSEYKNGMIVEDKLKITNAKNNKYYFSIVVEKEGKKHTLYFDKDGNRLRNTA